MRALSALLRQKEEVGRATVRYASALAVHGSPFVRLSSPAPSNIDHSPMLGTLAETKVPCMVHDVAMFHK